ncbi:hypothetical protein SPF06_07085 [Sinomonas sp. JGH33]|uniref:Major facilitator superfamily (MFS) profile domain-containing protein n=1 Tax=Sinomonas terricola TaxID=3110330 RepID=A0ABU5T4R8_9MICC|nr:hypothetical protein [Sinomonas sp. JGH33]MEA5454481.1 hypothetical protein [Sinomonas sp. JGH33]
MFLFILTTVLDLLGSLLVIAAAALAAAALAGPEWGLAASLGTAGVGIIAASWVFDRRRG